jgi:methylphosphotriester-DNA--protein-cysteine methyltransferase
VELWDLTPTPLDMLVGFSHENVGQATADYLLKAGYRRPGLLWTADRRADRRKQGLSAVFSREGINALPQARKPKRENVVFYDDVKSALDAGFRPCKVCCPTENAFSAPAFIEQAMRLVRDNPKTRIGDGDLRQQGIGPERVRRWFLKNHGITFQAFQRMQRVNVALQELKGGRTATDVAFDSGYESLSGFGYTCKKLTGHAPSERQQVILIHRFTTPIGPMFVCATDNGVCLLEFVDRRMLETEFSDLQRLLKANRCASADPDRQRVSNHA